MADTMRGTLRALGHMVMPAGGATGGGCDASRCVGLGNIRAAWISCVFCVHHT